MRWIKIEALEQGTTWLNIEKLYQIYIETPPNKPATVLAYRTKTEVEHYRVSNETREYLERILNTEQTEPNEPNI